MNMRRQHQERGFGMIEVMVALLVVMIGLLGLAGLQGTALNAEMEAYQRAQAIVLAKDMAARINANKPAASTYATGTPLGTDNDDPLGTGTVPTDCTALLGKDRDYCEWHYALLGAAETTAAGNSVGAMIGARGCVDYVAGDPEKILVTVAWQGLVPTKAPDVLCGKDADADGEDDYGDDKLRRVMSVPISIANLAE